LFLQQVVGFLVGFITQNITYTVYISAVGVVIAFLAVVPPWPMFNKYPVKFLPAMGLGAEGVTIVDSGDSGTKKDR